MEQKATQALSAAEEQHTIALVCLTPGSSVYLVSSVRLVQPTFLHLITSFLKLVSDFLLHIGVKNC